MILLVGLRRAESDVVEERAVMQTWGLPEIHGH